MWKYSVFLWNCHIFLWKYPIISDSIAPWNEPVKETQRLTGSEEADLLHLGWKHLVLLSPGSFLTRMKLDIVWCDWRVSEGSGGVSGGGGISMALPLGIEYERKKQKLQQELRMDYRHYMAQVTSWPPAVSVCLMSMLLMCMGCRCRGNSCRTRERWRTLTTGIPSR